MTIYNFNIETATSNGAVNSDDLTNEIHESPILIALESISTADGICTVKFRSELSLEDQALLTSIMSAHLGNERVKLPTQVSLVTGTNAPLPLAEDGKLYTLPNIFSGPVILNFAGAGDLETSRFTGELFGLKKIGAGQAQFSMNFLDGFWFAGGHFEWDGGSWGSSVSADLTATASTVVAPAVPGTGNCNLVPTGMGFNIIVPALGDGAYSLNSFCPVPAMSTETGGKNGYWDFDEPWSGKGTVTPGVPGKSKYNLYDIPLSMSRFCKLHLFRDSGSRDLNIPAIAPKWILPEWKILVTVNNAEASNTLRVSWDLTVARIRSF